MPACELMRIAVLMLGNIHKPSPENHLGHSALGDVRPPERMTAALFDQSDDQYSCKIGMKSRYGIHVGGSNIFLLCPNFKFVRIHGYK